LWKYGARAERPRMMGLLSLPTWANLPSIKGLPEIASGLAVVARLAVHWLAHGDLRQVADTQPAHVDAPIW
jgi:hypothetical protein